MKIEIMKERECYVNKEGGNVSVCDGGSTKDVY
jgi:hypothetical protein